MIESNFKLKSLQDTENIATKIAKIIEMGDTITLSGDLGVGKTSFVQLLINSLAGQKIEVTSPTFNILNIYKFDEIEVWHFDLYRLKSKNEVYELGIEDAYNNVISLIEWPGIISSLLPKDRLEIDLAFPQDLVIGEEARIITLRAFGKWHANNKDIKSEQ